MPDPAHLDPAACDGAVQPRRLLMVRPRHAGEPLPGFRPRAPDLSRRAGAVARGRSPGGAIPFTALGRLNRSTAEREEHLRRRSRDGATCGPSAVVRLDRPKLRTSVWARRPARRASSPDDVRATIRSRSRWSRSVRRRRAAFSGSTSSASPRPRSRAFCRCSPSAMSRARCFASDRAHARVSACSRSSPSKCTTATVRSSRWRDAATYAHSAPTRSGVARRNVRSTVAPWLTWPVSAYPCCACSRYAASSRTAVPSVVTTSIALSPVSTSTSSHAESGRRGRRPPPLIERAEALSASTIGCPSSR